MEFLLKPGYLLATALVGMLMHFLKKKVKGESLVEISGYFKANFKSTFISFVATVVSFAAYYLTLQTGTPADFLTVFGLGYMCDSAFNKWDGGA
jgi:hypothetical protein